MKVLCPTVTCVLTSHIKPSLGEAIESVLAQTRKDFHLLVLDSGEWIGGNSILAGTMQEIYDTYSRHPLIEWVTTGEPKNLRERACPVAYVTNQAIRNGLVVGKYMCTFYDDDLYYENFFERMCGYLDEHPDAGAVYCSEEIYALNHDKSFQQISSLPALAPRFGPGNFDCRMDGAQIMWRTEALDQMDDPWIPEDPAYDTCRHSDGLFLEKLARVVGTVYNIQQPLVKHRQSPWSTYTTNEGPRSAYPHRTAK